jgi:hypothetical protein
MKRTKMILMASVFVLAVSGAFATKAISMLQNGYDGNSATNCNPVTDVPNDCLPTNTGAICTNLHLLSDCSDVIRIPE